MDFIGWKAGPILAWLVLNAIMAASCSKEDRPPIPKDTTPPARITDLSAQSGGAVGSIRLEWTATGDDGTSGSADHYEVRYSTSAITQADFQSATLLPQSWGPLPPGILEVRLAVNLTYGQTFFFALVAFDEAGNASEVSNSDDAFVTAPDVTAPAAISDLAASPGALTGTVQLGWTATGDDGAAGTANGYDVRCSFSAINSGNFLQAPAVKQSMVPKASGQPETLLVSGLIPGQTYYFAVVASDESSNLSPVSNCPSAQATSGSDIWADLPPTQVPSPRSSHTAIWCGQELIIWGGLDAVPAYFNDGFKYDPSTHRWTAITTVGAPVGRANHQGVWTGKEMIVWGGDDYVMSTGMGSFKNSGGKYTPSLDRWLPMSTLGAPPGRRFHTAVWTGTDLIVFGGQNSAAYFGDGAVYNPAADVWTALPSQGAPSPRIFHSAVWTGTEMVIWGGENSSGWLSDGAKYNPATHSWSPVASPSPVLTVPARGRCATAWTGTQVAVWGGVGATSQTYILGDGALYTPQTNTWSAMSSAGAPSPRYLPCFGWSGNAMIVWGGHSGSQLVGGGAAYYPASNTWSALNAPGEPCPRWWPSASVAGSGLLVWGGFDNVNFFSDGASYDLSAGKWSPTLALSKRTLHCAAMAGTEAFFWGGYDGAAYLGSGGLYNPALDRWRPVTAWQAPSARAYATAVGAGSSAIVWGGYDGTQALCSGGRLDASTMAWMPVNNTQVSGVPHARYAHTAVWTGTYMIVWGGSDAVSLLAHGELYNLAADTWTPASGTNEPTARSGHSVIWTGTEMIVYGGHDGTSYLSSGARYNPLANTWTALPPPPAGNERSNHSAVWTGTDMIVFGGANKPGTAVTPLNTGLVYNPVLDSWTQTATTGAPQARYYHAAAWTGTAMFIWGGGGSGIFNSGYLYDPSTNAWVASSDANTPSARYQHAFVWTGNGLVVWGGHSGSAYLSDGKMYYP